MKTRIKFLVFWILTVLFAGASVWWIGTFPFDAARLYRAIPPEAWVVTEHDRLSERWDVMVRHPVVASMLEAAGVARADLESFGRDEAVAGLIRRLTPRRTVLAIVPAVGPTQEPAVVMASWIGFDGQLMRWGFFNRALSRWRRFRLPDGTRVWSLPCSGSLSGYALSLAVFEGVLVGALSKEPAAAALYRHRLEWDARLKPALAVWQRGAAERDAAGDAAGGLPPDRGWLPGVAGAALARRDAPCFTLDGWGDESLRLRLWWSAGWAPAGTVSADASDALRPLVHGRSAAVVLLAWEELAGLLRASWMPPDVRRVGHAVADVFPPETPAFVALNTGDYSGRVLGLRIPSVMAGVLTGGGDGAVERLSFVLDRLNAESSWVLIPRAQAGSGVVSIESARPQAMPIFGEQEKPALGQCAGWTVLSSSGQVLSRLVAECAAGTLAAGGPRPLAAVDDMRETRAPAGAFWIDGRRASPAVLSLFAAYELSLMARDLPQTGAARAALRRFEPWVEALGSLGHVDAAVHQPEGRTVLIEATLSGARR